MTSTNVIGPIDLPTWYSMRQCREAINWCKNQRDPKYDIEIHGEEEILRVYFDTILKRKEAA